MRFDIRSILDLKRVTEGGNVIGPQFFENIWKIGPELIDAVWARNI